MKINFWSWGKIRKYVRKKENVLIEFLGISFGVIIGFVALYLYLKGVLELPSLLGALSGLIIVSLPMYFYVIKKREQTLLISFTSKYLLEKDEANIDELLGILIAGKWKKLKIDPIEKFFKCIEGLCFNGDVEMRRRIAEALPALFKLNLEKSKNLVEILRHDWDKEKWKSDNRRRTIEALPYIIRKDRKFVRDNLHIIDKDEVFTIIAIVEVLNIWKQTFKEKEKEAEKHFEDLKSEMKRKSYKEGEIRAVSELWDLFGLVLSDVNELVKSIDKLKDTPNIYLQICIARNFRHLLCKGFPNCRTKNICNGVPEKILNLMEFFLQKDKHANVRRPIAKEDSLDCLVTLLRYGIHSKKAKKIIWTLINDEDAIIRVTAFDKIENILDIDVTFGKVILQHVATNNRHQKLVERAKNLQRREGQE